ncbi:MAG TPA: GDSL-type esterase/lipase family protein [Sandaracinaceae bacterium LLY-WYZ-13_1]|nr:GDSL-type esterase/lipase family protein [Sandaracinaceae bacterium LLY-WYZ-13_1]
MSGARKGLARGALAIVSLALTLGAAEGIYRWKTAAEDAPGGGDDEGYQEWRRRYRHMNETIYARSDERALIYEPVPGASVPMEYGPAAFNEGAMREDREVSPEPPPDTTRVAMIGDSLVWSEFLPVHDSLPRRTEEALGEGWEVLNFGVTGYDTTQEAAWYERAVRPYHPDVVVVVWCMNDMMIMSGPFERFADDEERARKDAQEALMARVAPVRRETIDGVLEQRERDATFKILARALGIWERWRFDRDYDDEYLVAFRQPERRARAARAIRRLGALLRADGVPGLFVISPVLEAWDAYHWGSIHDFLRGEAEAAGLTVLDPLPTWRADERESEMHVGGDNLHYDQSGARVFGRTVAPALEALAAGGGGA